MGRMKFERTEYFCFFQAEDGIRDLTVTGVQTCALPIFANLAMATGNLGREGVGVSPLRGQNNVQGSCDMGSFPHEFSAYRHVSDPVVRKSFEEVWGVQLQSEPGLRIPNMFEAALDGTFKGMYVQGEDFVQRSE